MCCKQKIIVNLNVGFGMFATLKSSAFISITQFGTYTN